MCGIRVVVDTTEERRCRILANVLREQMTATGMFIQEVRDIVNEASNDDQRSLLGLFEDYSSVSAWLVIKNNDNSQDSYEMTGRSLLSVGHLILS